MHDSPTKTNTPSSTNEISPPRESQSDSRGSRVGNESSKRTSFFKEVVQFSLIALLVVVPIRFFVAQPFVVSGASMAPTFDSGEYLIVDQVSRRFEPLERGDVVIFKYPRDPSKYFIKRVIGLPGETVTLQGSSVSVTTPRTEGSVTETFVLDEPYVTEENAGADFTTTVLENREYFVLGDNRRASSDSRIWGALPEENIVGHAFLRLLPLSRIDYLPGSVEYE